ncbi:hypothetical protein [Erythrobacter sp. HL-111]|uniref:hypothetical protein n=1 Tax=Erythrobacter sp. HL-111 TaxID=1798193 RepID=UPI000AE04C32|nr:hypothetical protein [Erythrobacter sp. HL-111]
MNSRIFNTTPPEVSEMKALNAFEAALREMQPPSKAVTAEAVRELFGLTRNEADAAQATADQLQAELSDAFHAFLTLHEDTPAFARLKADHGRLLRLASAKRGRP